jgi:hypothetical protein
VGVSLLYNANDFIKLIKKTAVEAVNASKPANMVFGTVVSPSPLKIMVDQKLILTSAQLALSRNVTDYEVEMTVDHLTEEASNGDEHDHPYKGKKVFLVHNALKSGEEVILMQVSGGQKYIVLDRIEKG